MITQDHQTAPSRSARDLFQSHSLPFLQPEHERIRTHKHTCTLQAPTTRVFTPPTRTLLTVAFFPVAKVPTRKHHWHVHCQIRTPTHSCPIATTVSRSWPISRPVAAVAPKLLIISSKPAACCPKATSSRSTPQAVGLPRAPEFLQLPCRLVAEEVELEDQAEADVQRHHHEQHGNRPAGRQDVCVCVCSLSRFTTPAANSICFK